LGIGDTHVRLKVIAIALSEELILRDHIGHVNATETLARTREKMRRRRRREKKRGRKRRGGGRKRRRGGGRARTQVEGEEDEGR